MRDGDGDGDEGAGTTHNPAPLSIAVHAHHTHAHTHTSTSHRHTASRHGIKLVPDRGDGAAPAGCGLCCLPRAPLRGSVVRDAIHHRDGRLEVVVHRGTAIGQVRPRPTLGTHCARVVGPVLQVAHSRAAVRGHVHLQSGRPHSGPRAVHAEVVRGARGAIQGSAGVVATTDPSWAHGGCGDRGQGGHGGPSEHVQSRQGVGVPQVSLGDASHGTWTTGAQHITEHSTA